MKYAAKGGALRKRFYKSSQYPQKNNCVKVSLFIKPAALL